MIDNLIETVNNHLKPLHDYMALRKKTLELDELHMYDLFTPMVKDFKKEISFDEAKEIVLKALEPLGKEYLDVVRSAFSSGWIDKYENEGKRSGAYSAGAKVHPFVLMNYADTIDNMFTLAHEMGHAMHSYLSNRNQPNIYSNYKIFVAEVASLVNELLLANYMLNNSNDKNEKLNIWNTTNLKDEYLKISSKDNKIIIEKWEKGE